MDRIFYRKRTTYTYLILSTILFFIIMIFSIVFICQANYIYFLILVWPFIVCLMFIAIAVMEYKSTLKLTDTEISINYCVFSNEKELNRKKAFVAYNDIRYIESEFIKGFGIITKDTTIYIFHLKDGRNFRTYFHGFGPNAEKKIVSLLSQKVDVM